MAILQKNRILVFKTNHPLMHVKLSLVIKIFVLSIFECPFYTGFSVYLKYGSETTILFEKVMNANMFGKVQVQFLLMNEILWAKAFLITSFGVL